jgi:16S rRNA (guanine966-N2)-methyltransferase
MRIIAGRWRGRRIEAPSGERTRPILDRAKTVLFDVLGHRLAEPGRLPPIAVLDLYAGSGSLGLEALSRGARYCRFVEQHRAAARLLRANLDALGIIREAEVTQGDAAHVEIPAPMGIEPGTRTAFELVFVDPPYRLLEGRRPAPEVADLLARLAGDSLIHPSAWVVVRHSLQPDGGPDLAPLVEVERRDVGRMTFRFLATGRTRLVDELKS